MATIFLKHPVADYAAWRPLYDGDAPRRAAAGLTDVAVYRDAADSNMLLLVWTAEDTSGLDAMMKDEDLKAKMQEAGVTGPPEVWVAE